MSFNYFDFKEQIEIGDLYGLEYLEETLIKDLKERLEKNEEKDYRYSREEYLIELFLAVKSLNVCNDIYETSYVKNKFNFDIYSIVRDKFLEELGLQNVWED